MPAARRPSRPRRTRLDPLAPAALFALALHSALLFGWHIHAQRAPLIVAAPEAMQFSFLEPDAAAPAAPAPPSVPVPEPPPPEPVPEVAPVPKVIETVRPATPLIAAPAKPAATPPASPKPVRSTPRGRPSTVSTTPAAGGGGPASTGAAASGTGAGKANGRPVYSVRPSPIYPSESRAAHEEGVVILRLTVNAEGRPTAVSVARSSGFPKLDRAAVEAGWQCRVSNAGNGMQFEAPIRFDLRASLH